MTFDEREVKNQYENYPYPRRDPEQERVRLVNTPSNQLDRINHYCFSGKECFGEGFRALVAGGGTGDAVIMLAEQLRDFPAKITYLDMSNASMQIAQQRANVRGLTNIEWIEDSLLNLPQLGIGKFDYINCSGVLHHLENPEAGLKALKSVLKPGGAIAIMLYGLYGRTGVYLIQDLMRLINQNVEDMQSKVDNTKAILGSLPKTNMQGLAARGRYQIDIKDFGDIGIYDLFLHSQDRAYTIPQLYEFVESQGLKIIQLFGDLHRNEEGLILSNLAYDAAAFVQNPEILDAIQELAVKSQQAIAELLHGGYHMHTFYVARQVLPRPDISDLDYVPVFTIQWPGGAGVACGRSAHSAQGNVIINEQGPAGEINCKIEFKKTPHAHQILTLINGERSLRDIYKSLQLSNPGSIAEELHKEFENLYIAFHMHNRMFMRHKSVPSYPTIQEMQDRIM